MINIKEIVTKNKYLLTILFVYIISRFYLYIVLKIEFTADFKYYLIQYLDISLLKSNLIESIMYLHSQPPLFNLLIGIVEIVFGNLSFVVFFVLFHILGLLTVILSYKILIMLNVRKVISLIIVIIYTLTPATIIYENLFFYTHFIVFFLVFATFHLIRFAKTKYFWNALFYFVGLLLAILTTSFFHLIWFLLLTLFLLISKMTQKRIILKASVLPFVIILSLYLKNYFLFDQFSTSTWFGMNLSKITVQQLGNQLKQKLINEKKLSRVSKIAPFTHYVDLDTFTISKYFLNKKGIAVLDQKIKLGGRTNFNNYGYYLISTRMLNDDLFIIKNYPQIYLNGVLKSFSLYFNSPTKYNLITSNVIKIEKFNKIYDAFIYGSSRQTKTGYTAIMLIVVIIGSSIYLLFKQSIASITKIYLVFALMNILYVMFVGNLFEYGENNRFRFYTEIFYYLNFALIINEFFSTKRFNKTII